MARALCAAALVALLAVVLQSHLLSDSAISSQSSREWGYREASTAVVPFVVADRGEMTVVRAKLAGLRSGHFLNGTGWRSGAEMGVVGRVLRYWADEYDWTAEVRRLNSLPQYSTVIQGLRLRFYHSVNQTDKPAILLLHGWPGSTVEFIDLMHRLAGKFSMVAPSLPGFGWSDASEVEGLGPVEIAGVMANLMERLAYKRYFCQGGDWGALICQALARLVPGRIQGLHLNMFPVAGVRAVLGTLPLLLQGPAEERSKMFPISKFLSRLVDGSGYFHVQATTPALVGIAGDDSPAALAAWIIEKFARWCHCNQVGSDPAEHCDPTTVISMPVLVTNLMIYWVPRASGSAAHLYQEAANSADFLAIMLDAVRVPVGLAEFPGEILPPPKQWVHWKYLDIVSHTKFERGGHFAALERPEELAADLTAFIGRVLKRDDKLLD